MNKKICVIGGISILLIVGILLLIWYLRIVFADVEVVLVDDLSVSFLEEKKVSDFIKYINGDIVDDYIVSTNNIGKKNISFKFINNDGVKVNYDFDIEVVDRVKPVIWVSNTYKVLVNSEDNILSNIMCGDNEDPSPKCSIIGNYDLSSIGEYEIQIKAIDRSGNEAIRNITLSVVDEMKDTNSKKEKVLFSSVLKNYKNNNTLIGVDISKWQGNVDFEKLVNAGVSFVVLKIGNSADIGGSPEFDPKFIYNIEEASKYNLNIMVYFYSRANSKKIAIEEARWVLKNISKYNVSGIAYDWENWSSYNKYNLSFYNLSDMAYSFLNVVKGKGYDGYLYSSKSYLENIWIIKNNRYYTWLAHYTDKTNYLGDYKLWQMCDTGIIDGIDGYVDIDIMYLD